MKILTDFHHSSLLRSLVLLFENRLGHELYRPIGMEWYREGFWAIFPSEDTAQQFLSLDQAYKPADGSPPLNSTQNPGDRGIYRCFDPGGRSDHAAITLEAFNSMKFDIVICSLPQHVKPFQELVRRYQPQAKLIVQVGNEWDLGQFSGLNVLASLSRRDSKNANVRFYHQEIDLDVFTKTDCIPSNKVYSFIHLLDKTKGWDDFLQLEKATSYFGCEWKSFGGQCRDGGLVGDHAVAEKMRESMLVFHVKRGGDGFGHVIHSAYASGRPVIVRKSDYAGKLADELLVPGTFIDLDNSPIGEAKNTIHRLLHSPGSLGVMGAAAAYQFHKVVDYQHEAEAISMWLDNLI